jgi:hypothetical protein
LRIDRFVSVHAAQVAGRATVDVAMRHRRRNLKHVICGNQIDRMLRVWLHIPLLHQSITYATIAELRDTVGLAHQSAKRLPVDS